MAWVPGRNSGVADSLPDLELLTPDGEREPLRAVAAGRPLVVVFVRHFG